MADERRRSGGAALLVATGILASRLAGFVRERMFAHVFGNSDAADVFRAAFRIPNLLQNLFGEGVLSASFIPEYSKLLETDPKLATRVAGVVLSLLALVTSVLVLGGVAATPLLIDAIAPGFHGDKRESAIELVRILFPGLGLLVLSAFCLGVLNSHRRFLASYLAPVAFNAAMIASLATSRGERAGEAIRALAIAAVVGSGLQLAVQLPLVLPLVRGLRPSLSLDLPPVRRVASAFFPVLVSRGVVQVSAYVESMLASLLPTGAVAALGYAQVVYMLPVSLFGMSIAASELPEMARDSLAGGELSALSQRLGLASRRVLFFVAPSAVAFVAIGDRVSALLFQSGRFGHGDALYVWGLLAGSAVGLTAATQSRLVSSAFFALGDTRTPLVVSASRVVLGTVAGALLALRAPAAFGVDAKWGAVGLALATSVSAAVELAWLRRALARRLAVPALPPGFVARVLGAAALAGAAGFGAGRAVDGFVHAPSVAAIAAIAAFGLVYGGATALLGVAEARATLARIAARVRRA